MEQEYLIGGINIILLVFGLVEFVKKLGIKGVWLTLASLILGMLAGFAFRLVTVGLPVTYQDWIITVVFGLAMGLTASGVYDFLNKRLPAS